MSNIILCWGNRADASTLSNGSWNSSLPLTNLKDPNVRKVARTLNAGPAATLFAADMGATYTLRGLALANTNLSSAATVQVKAGTAAPDSSNNFATGLVYDSTALNAKQLSFFGDIPTDWGQQYPIIFPFATAVTARYVTVTIVDGSNPDGYVQIGRLFMANGIQPTVNPEYGLQDGRDELSTIVKARSGTLYAQKITPRPRWVQFHLPYLSQAEADIVHEMDAAIGLTDEVLYIPDPSNLPLTQRYGMLGLIHEMSALEYPQYNGRGKAYRIDQKV